jgi:hypothetical protein
MWFLLLEKLFKTDLPLAARLWKHIPNATTVAWQLELLRARTTSYQTVEDRTRHLATILTPSMMFQASVALEPEGRSRSKEIRAFEERVLCMVKQGAWKW